jgi:aminoglycoside phosphotransferase (APT) family kinase protein
MNLILPFNKEHDFILKSVEALLSEKLLFFAFKGQGMCNNTFRAKSEKYGDILIKSIRQDPETDEQNDLIIEAEAIRFLKRVQPGLPIPEILFIAENPKMYAYRFIEGDMMIDAWPRLNEEQRLGVCRDLGKFHADIAVLSENDAHGIGLVVRQGAFLEEHVLIAYDKVMADQALPDNFSTVARKAFEFFEKTKDYNHLQFVHNDAHNENTLIYKGTLAGLVDFGDCEYNDVHADFAYYPRHYPRYVSHIVKAYEEHSHKKLSFDKIASYAALVDLDELLYYFYKNEEGRQRAITRMSGYEYLLFK